MGEVPLKTAVLTMAKGRHEHLLGQVDGLSVGSRPPDLHCVVSMGDRDLTRGRLPLGTDRWRTLVRPVPSDRRALPLAAARNAAAEAAMAEGAEVLVFLGGDVIPGGRTLERYIEAILGHRDDPGELTGPVVWTGSLRALPPPENETIGYPYGLLSTLAAPDPFAATLEPGQRVVETRWELFRGDAFAMSADDFTEVGGFCADYAGHGLEDADFGEKVKRAGGSLVRLGGASSYLQPVPPPEPADQQRVALRHAAIWRSRWGTDPQHPLFEALVEAGVLARAQEGGYRAV